jgi:dipeptidyl aminopeptidase/acylaminoacyl peptidase
LVRRLFAVAAAAALLCGPRPSGAADLKPLTYEALRSLVTVREPQIAPDGSRVVYVRAVGDYKADHMDTDLVLVDVATGARRVLTHDRIGVQSPRWSPSGDAIAYLASPARTKPPQLYVMPMNGGDAEQITNVKSGVDGFDWRPDGAAFAYLAQDDPPKTKLPEGYVAAFPVTEEHFLTREPPRPSHLWTVNADGKGAKQLTKGPESPTPGSGDVRWTHDGRSLLVTEQPDAIFAHLTKARTVAIDVATGAVRPLRADGADGGFALSHDGTRVALAVPRHGSLYLQVDADVRDVADGRDVRSLAPIDRSVQSMMFSGGDDALLVGTFDGVRSVLWRAPMSGAPARVDLGEVDFGFDGTVSKDGTLAFVGRRRDDPAEIYVLPPKGAPKKLTAENGFLTGYVLARRERVDWVSDDGTPVNGVLTYPTSYEAGKKYPLVLDIHGGPVSTSTWDFSGVDASNAEILATHGFLVLQPNYRGSDNSGDAFLQAIVPHVTSGPGRDNLAGVEAIKKMGIVDESRIGVSGWSGGGLQTAWLIGHASYWRAAVAGAGVYDWTQQAVLADINEQFALDFLGVASPYTKDGRAAFAAESPITYVDAIRTPLLILSDTGDQRVPVAQSYALYHALKARGRPVTFVAFPRGGHFPADPVGREAAMKQWTGWFDRWMK